jgi:valine--pyruvate aminotransferase
MKLSRFGESFGSAAGIVQLMDDLGEAMAVDRDMLMLGGGNPGRIPEMQQRFRARMREVLDDGECFDRLVGEYGPPQGHPGFVEALARLLRDSLGWDVGPEHVALTNGSQSASFMLFNMLGGEHPDGRHRRILLPLTPEYIGYADQGAAPDLFVSSRPRIELLDGQQFKYHVDFDAVRVDDDVGAICVSRPTNPTGNVLTDTEMQTLSRLAATHDVPLIVDNAYGLPFPGIVFSEASPVWNEHLVVCMSLSKLGLPGVRTGIVVAAPELVRAIAGMNAIVNLTTGGFGPELVLDMVRSGEVLNLSREVVRPFYRRKAEAAVRHLQRDLAGTPFRVHRPEGAIFLWLWFPDLPIDAQALYERLKARGVLIIPGHHFFPGLAQDWQHRHECIRVNYALDDDRVHAGLAIIADEVKKAYAQA